MNRRGLIVRSVICIVIGAIVTAIWLPTMVYTSQRVNKIIDEGGGYDPSLDFEQLEDGPCTIVNRYVSHVNYIRDTSDLRTEYKCWCAVRYNFTIPQSQSLLLNNNSNYGGITTDLYYYQSRYVNEYYSPTDELAGSWLDARVKSEEECNALINSTIKFNSEDTTADDTFKYDPNVYQENQQVPCYKPTIEIHNNPTLTDDEDNALLQELLFEFRETYNCGNDPCFKIFSPDIEYDVTVKDATGAKTAVYIGLGVFWVAIGVCSFCFCRRQKRQSHRADEQQGVAERIEPG